MENELVNGDASPVTFSIFSHPDCTVGSGFSPDLLCDESLGSRAHLVAPGIPPVWNCQFGRFDAIEPAHHAPKIVVKLE